MESVNTQIFLSYCQKDRIIADSIEKNLMGPEMTIFRDIRDISKWKSIKEYMNSINNMDYVIMIVSENYLKSEACMYEVLETMKDHEYSHHIFPVIVDNRVYDPIWQMDIVQYWQNKMDEYTKHVGRLNAAFAGQFNNDIRHCQNIASAAGDFMKQVADMNNPNIEDVTEAIKMFLTKNGEISSSEAGSESVSDTLSEKNISSRLGIPLEHITKHKITDLEKNNFTKSGYKKVIMNLKALFGQLQESSPSYQVEIEEPTLRDTIIDIYHDGKACHKIAVFLDSLGAGSLLMIGVSNGISFSGDHHSFNESYTVDIVDGKLCFKALCSFTNRGNKLDADGVTKHIWEQYILPSL